MEPQELTPLHSELETTLNNISFNGEDLPVSSQIDYEVDKFIAHLKVTNPCKEIDYVITVNYMRNPALLSDCTVVAFRILLDYWIEGYGVGTLNVFIGTK